jgi:hypothetical protein
MFAHGESNATKVRFPKPIWGPQANCPASPRDTQFSKISFVNPLTFRPPTHILLRDSQPRYLGLDYCTDFRVLCLAGLDHNPTVLLLRVILVSKKTGILRL